MYKDCCIIQSTVWWCNGKCIRVTMRLCTCHTMTISQLFSEPHSCCSESVLACINLLLIDTYIDKITSSKHSSRYLSKEIYLFQGSLHVIFSLPVSLFFLFLWFLFGHWACSIIQKIIYFKQTDLFKGDISLSSRHISSNKETQSYKETYLFQWNLSQYL